MAETKKNRYTKLNPSNERAVPVDLKKIKLVNKPKK